MIRAKKLKNRAAFFNSPCISIIIMDQNAMEQAWTFLKEFTSVFAKSVQSTKVTEAFAKDLYEVFSGFARDLQKLIDRNSDGFFESGTPSH